MFIDDVPLGYLFMGTAKVTVHYTCDVVYLLETSYTEWYGLLYNFHEADLKQYTMFCPHCTSLGLPWTTICGPPGPNTAERLPCMIPLVVYGPPPCVNFRLIFCVY